MQRRINEDAELEASEAIEALAIVLTLIALTILFEKMKHAAEHRAGRALRPIVETLFGELTVLGFLSMVTYILDKAGVFLTLSKTISNGLHGEEEGEEDTTEEDDEVFELVERIHFAMFFVMVVFLISVLFEVQHGLQSQMEWCQWDRACHDEAYVNNLLQKNDLLSEEYETLSSMPGIRGMARRTWRSMLPYLRFLPFLRDKSRESLEDKLVFCSLRVEFYKERSVDPPFAAAGEVEGNPKTIGDHFNFGRYLTFAYAKKMAAVVEIDVATWLFFAGGTMCYFFLFSVLGYSLQDLAGVWVLIGWIFHIVSIRFEKYLLGIRDRFLAVEFVPELKVRMLSWNTLYPLGDNDSNLIGTEEEPLRKLGDGLPLWCYNNIDELDRKRSKLSKLIFYPTPQNRQHALYLFGHNGPTFHILCLRIMLVFSCIYSAQLVILFVPMMAWDENTTTPMLIVYCVLAFVPALAFIFNKKRLIAALVQVGTIGSFVLPQAISDSEREEKTSMAVRVLVIYFKLARMTKQFLAAPSMFQLNRSDSHYTNVLSVEEITELGRMFRLFFDSDGDGFLSRGEFQSLLSTAGISVSDGQADVLLRAMIKSANSVDAELKDASDGKIALSTDVFFQWYTNQLSDDDDTKECAQFLFSLFDDDNSGDITVLEFKQQLDKMSIGISHQEADELIQELDIDGNGVLCASEFEDLIEHFYPIEFKHHSENSEG